MFLISNLALFCSQSLTFVLLSAFDLSSMAREASGHGLHDAATAFLEAATKKAEQEKKNKISLVILVVELIVNCFNFITYKEKNFNIC